MNKRGMAIFFVIAALIFISYSVYAPESDDSSTFIVQGGGNNCTAGWKCKNANKLGYQNANCSWSSGLIDCPNGCLNGACQNQTCTPKTCSQLGKQCGSWSDGCSGTLDCGTCQSGYSCSNGLCAQQANATCTDSDGGLNYSVKGTTKGVSTIGSYVEQPDYCDPITYPSGKGVIEFYCDNNVVTPASYECPNGCEGGACQKRCYSTVIGEDCYKKCRRFLWWRWRCRTECVPKFGTICE